MFLQFGICLVSAVYFGPPDFLFCSMPFFLMPYGICIVKARQDNGVSHHFLADAPETITANTAETVFAIRMKRSLSGSCAVFSKASISWPAQRPGKSRKSSAWRDVTTWTA